MSEIFDKAVNVNEKEPHIENYSLPIVNMGERQKKKMIVEKKSPTKNK